MATFVFSSVMDSVGSFKNKVNNSIFGQVYSYFNPSVDWKKDKVKGKLNEIAIQTSTYNKIIPNIYGTMRLSGNIIWMGEVKEVKEEVVYSVQTGKNKKTKQSNTTYYYYLSFAIAISKGEIEEIKNIWIDTDVLLLHKYAHRFYSGTSEQMPDPLIESIEGKGKACAYRDICYIVFENFPLSDFGNRIPNFSFEVKRKELVDYNDTTLLENMITGVNLIPGCGEFVYSASVEKKIKYFGINETILNNRIEKTRLNQNNNEGKADCSVSLDQLQKNLKNCNWVSPVVVWFGNDLNIKNCKIQPKIEYKYDELGDIIHNDPNEWTVGKYNRSSAEVVSYDGDNIRYGGTISDNSIISLLRDLKNRNLKSMLYPMLFMDVKDKPWRGYLAGNADDVENFYNNEYEPFILHYADLAKNLIDAFIIGSELKGLTKIKDINNNFPFVEKMIILAGKCKKILGNNVKISYAGDWSEYHHTDGGWFNMDKLWANKNIDFIGIDAYFPLTKTNQNSITKDMIKNGWSSGEFYDYYYDNNIKYDLEPQFAIKNIKYFIENIHINPDMLQTEWIPNSKKVWFTEYGFASVDATTNEPYKFYDQNSVDGGFPLYSNGVVDFYAQKIALQATEEYWSNSAIVEQKFVWCWDARPYPYFPNRIDIWSDGGNWKYGHWLNGKLNLTQASNIIKQLCIDAGLNVDLIDVVNIDDDISGLILNNSVNLIDALEVLKNVYFFDIFSKNGKITFNSTKNILSNEIIDIYEDELIIFNSDNSEVNIDIINKNIDDIPQKLKIIFLDKNLNYDANIVYSERENCESQLVQMDTLPVALDENKAKYVSETNLYLQWLEKNVFKFVLPIKYIFLEINDLIRLNLNHNSYLLKIKKFDINENLSINVEGLLFDNKIYKNNQFNGDNSGLINIQKDVGNTLLNIFEIPAINNDMLEKSSLFFALNSEEEGWVGASLYHSNNFNSNYKLLDAINENSITGMLLNELKVVKSHYFDYENKINIVFHSKINESELYNYSEIELFNGKNIAILGDEVLQFKNAILNENGSYTLSGCLRGLFGTEQFINTHKKGDYFILLNNTIIKQTLDVNQIYNNNEYKAVSISGDFLITNPIKYDITGLNLKPLAPCHINYYLHFGTLFLSWFRRDRGVQNWRSELDNFLVETKEIYYLEIIQNDIVIHKASININKYEFSVKDLTSSIKIRICQQNDLIGNGYFSEVNIDL